MRTLYIRLIAIVILAVAGAYLGVAGGLVLDSPKGAVPDAASWTESAKEVSTNTHTSSCNSYMAVGDGRGYPDIDTLFWVSHQVVTGTIVDQRPPSIHTGTISTDYVFRVEQRFRGVPGQTVLIHQGGGTIGDCRQEWVSNPTLTVGDRLLLFLGSPIETVNGTAYWITGDRQGVWRFNDDGTIAADNARPSTFNGAPFEIVAGHLQRIVAAAVPVQDPDAVPLEEAPVP
ncbi:hypothetical protein [Nitrolancea hollandica]|uniref:Uncharacterized protein n=1 Tax=Nitrolancea hollandica Lb TaxID=1129897 RepID=I4EI67_9BACT|nr:hypothetical protein [Nitrolancea hollandica]CCF84379.1 exported hypothetical protein [Nitrolancea hollandica Lb]